MNYHQYIKLEISSYPKGFSIPTHNIDIWPLAQRKHFFTDFGIGTEPSSRTSDCGRQEIPVICANSAFPFPLDFRKVLSSLGFLHDNMTENTSKTPIIEQYSCCFKPPDPVYKSDKLYSVEKEMWIEAEYMYTTWGAVAVTTNRKIML